MDEKQLKLLFDDYASKSGFADYNEFKTLMSDSASRSVFFKESNKDLGFKDYNEFEDLLGFKKKEDGGVDLSKYRPSVLQLASTEPPKKLTYSDINAKIESVTKAQKNLKTVEARQMQYGAGYIPTVVDANKKAESFAMSELDKATKDKQTVFTEYSKEISRPVEKLIETGEYKNFFTPSGNLDYGKAKQHFLKVTDQLGGGPALVEHWVANLKQRGQGEMERAAIEPEYKKNLESMGLGKYADPEKYGRSIIDGLNKKYSSQTDLVIQDRDQRASAALDTSKQKVDSLTQDFNKTAESLNDMLQNGQLDEASAKAKYNAAREQYESAVNAIDKEYRTSIAGINKSVEQKYNRIKKEIDALYEDPNLVAKSIPEADRKNIEKAYTTARAKYVSSKEAVDRAVDEASGTAGLFARSVTSGFLSGISNIGDALASNGYQNGLVDWMQSKRTAAEEIKPAQYEWSKDPLKRAITSSGQSLGASAPLLIPSIAATMATGGGTSGIVASALLSYYGENKQNAGQLYRDVLENTGDVNLAREKADEYLGKTQVTLPLYFVGSLGDKALLLGKGLKKAAAGFGLEMLEETPVEYIQSHAEETTKGTYKGGIGQYVLDNPEMLLDLTVGTAVQSGAMKTVGAAFAKVAKNVPSSPTQTYADAVINQGSAFAVRLAQAQFEQGMITEQERDSRVEQIKAISANMARLDELGVRGDAAKLHMALSEELKTLKQDRQQESDESVQAVIDGKIKETQDAMTNILSGKAEMIVFGMPGDVNSKVMLASQFNALPADEQDQMVLNAKSVTAINNDQLNTQLQDKKLALGNPEGAPDGAYNEDATLQSARQQQAVDTEGGVQERPGTDGGQQEVGQGARQQGQAPVTVPDTGDSVRRSEEEVRLAEELTTELRQDLTPIVERAAQSLSSANISFEVLDDAEFTRQAGQSAEGAFITTDATGKILLNRDKMEGADPGVIVWHESAHPVMNIIRNTNRPLYDRAVQGLKQAAASNPTLQAALDFGRQYGAELTAKGRTQQEADAVMDDESIVESIAQIAADERVLSTIPTSLKQVMIDFVNYMAKVLGVKGRVANTASVEFKRLAREVASAIKEGRDISEIVGAENVTQFMSNLSSPSVVAHGEFEVQLKLSDSTVGVYESKEVSPLPKRSIQDVYDTYGGKAVVINSDPTRVGELILPSGKKIFMYGGPAYLAVKDNADSNVGFATTQISKVNSWMKYVKGLFGDNPGVTLVATQAPTSIMSNSYSLRYVMDAISMLPKSVLRSKEFKSEFFGNDLVLLKDAFGEEGYNDFVDKYKKADLSNPEVIDGMISEMGYKVGDDNKPASFKARGAFVSNLLGGLAAKSSLKGVEGDVGYVSKTPQKFIAKQLMDRFGINQEKLIRDIGEPSLVDLYMNDGKWGMVVTGFEVDPTMTVESAQKGGVKHPLFNAKFPGKNPFILDGAYEVDSMFKPVEMTGPSGAPYTKRAGQMLAGSMYVRGAQTQAEQTFEYAPAPAATTGLQYSMGNRQAIIDKAKADGTYLKAPNGQPTKLTEDQWTAVRTPEFKNWFGDWENDPQNASKVVDSNGEPMVVYHGTDKTFDTFMSSKAEGWGDGMYFASNLDDTKEFGETLYEVFLNIRRPVTESNKADISEDVERTKAWEAESKRRGRWDSEEGVSYLDYRSEEEENIDLVNKAWRELGHDGIMFEGSNNLTGMEIVTFNPNQIKSATDNVGTFSTEDNRIQFSMGNRPEQRREFKLVAFVLRKKAEGYTDGQIAFAINSALPTMTPQEILSLLRDPKQYLQNAFPGMTSLQYTNLLRRAEIANIYRPRGFTPKVTEMFLSMGVDQEVLDRYYMRVKTRKQVIMETIDDWFKKGFDPAKGLPKWIMQAKESARGARSLEIAQAKKTLDKLAAVSKKIGFDDWELFKLAMKSVDLNAGNTTMALAPYAPSSAPLSGLSLEPPVRANNPVLARLPLEIQPFVTRMRNQIDGLSNKLVAGGFVNPAVAVAIEKNLGQYITRSYRLFNEQGFTPDPRAYNAAVDYLANEEYRVLLQEFYDKNVKPELPSNQARIGTDQESGQQIDIPYADLMVQAVENAKRRVDDIITRKDNPYFGSGSVESRDTGILKTRKFIPVAIRELMGEYTDPGITFMMTVAKQASLAASSQFLKDLRKQGLGTMFFEKNDPNRPQGYNTPIAGEKSSALEPLNGLYTTAEIYEALQDAEVTRNRAVQFWMKVVSTNRWFKTVGSIRTQFVNFESNLGFAVMNGLIFTKEGRPLGRAMAESKSYVSGQYRTEAEMSEITKKAIALGLVGQDIDINAIKQAFKENDMFEMALDVALTDKGIFKKVSKKVRPMAEFNKLYRMGDDFWKVYGYMSERAQIAKLRFGGQYESLTSEQQDAVDREAADRAKDTWPTYDRMWNEIRSLSQNIPILGNFVAFQAESMRVMINAGKLVAKDMKDPQMQTAAMRRAGGMLAYVGIRTAITTAVPLALGYGVSGVIGALINDDEEEDKKWALKEVSPLFMRTGDIFAYQSKDKPHMYTVIDMLSIDPLGIPARSMNAFTEGTDTFDPGIVASVSELIGGFLEREMTFKLVEDLANNYNSRNGLPIWNSEDKRAERVGKVADYAWQSLKPSTWGLIERAISNENKIAEATAFGGFRPYEVDLHRSFDISLSKMQNSMSEISREYGAISRDEKKSDQEKEEARIRAGEKKASVIAKYHRLYSTLIKLGADPEVMEEIVNSKSSIKMTGMDKKTKAAIIDGEVDPTTLY